MDFDLYRKIIDTVAGWASQVSLFLAGEPLLYKRLKDAIEYAHAKGLRTRVHSNLLLLSECNIDTLLNSALDELSISFDGPTHTHYNAIRAGGDFDTVLRNTRWLLEEKRRRGLTKPYIVIQSIQLKEESAEDLFSGNVRLLEGLAYDEIKVIPSHSFAGYYKNGVRGINKQDDLYDACGMLYNRLTVLWDGRVVSCCNDFEAKYVCGDVRERPLMEIWNGDRFRRLRKVFRDRRHREINLCRSCDVPYSIGRVKKKSRGDGTLMLAVARFMKVFK